jgi:hypothetical protein
MALSRLSHSLVSGGDIERNHGVFPQSRLSIMRYRRSAFRASEPKVHRGDPPPSYFGLQFALMSMRHSPAPGDNFAQNRAVACHGR